MGVVYTADVVSAGDGRNGSVRSSDGVLELGLASPKEVGGPGGATNPEQLFAAGYAACFHSALRLSAREAKVALAEDTVSARVHLERDESGYSISADLVVALPGVPEDVARSLVEQAHGRCPYSKAVRDSIRVGISLAP
ncbi:organic hydroperoxide resistance protein [Streptomyces klenkii]|uniref:Organic hydroperoxide resistance protein n=1 Tax=Streptomyces klenkii TaxID=1420899 RepID=A0A3B0B9T4_9ACTN|nr:organic hydroperoxide resistance protein [Streptomyces klenkii]RKN69970.1 organic hydroperoxide resistance protein [Streptomyces klenkii]